MFKIYDTREAVQPITRLALRANNTFDDVIRLVVVDELGNNKTCGSLIGINNKGELAVYSNINPNLGLSLDRCGKLKQVDI